ncbi:MAG TPA: dihydroorotate dehydrogenase [Longimicrobiales bacterium]|nr:dihydroorotate dehydrogenase [Longimicrobiales bacterium]
MRLEIELFGTTFQNPVLLAAGTAGFGVELAEVIDVDRLGGLVTKSVTLEPRSGNPAPRVAEFAGGMLNSIGLANPGVEAALRDKLPWLAANVSRARVFVSVAGHTVQEFFTLVERLDGAPGFLGFELNLSCPNDARRGDSLFALDPEAVAEIVSGCRARTARPLIAKLAPHDPDLAHTVRVAAESGADGLTLVNTMPGLLLAAGTGRPALGAGAGGTSGHALLPLGLRAVREARRQTRLPLLGAGGVSAAPDAVAYARAGASLVQVGTASFASPRAGLLLVEGLRRWGARHGVASWQDLVGCGAG